MQINEYTSLKWSDNIKSTSRAVDLLGIWSQHLKIQVEFTRAITSVTNRVRYYTLIAYYFEYLTNIIDDSRDYERIFILSCLAHHNGEFNDLRYVINKTRFKDDWSNKKSFDLDFPIAGQGWGYYNKQLARFRSVWIEYGFIKKTPINKKLASSLKNVSTGIFRQKTFTKEELKELGEEGFCICDSESNENEIDVMSKLLFGFISKINGNWDIDEEEYHSFENGTLNLELDFETFSEDFDVKEMNIKRRNTLLLFLKIIYETKPPKVGFQRHIWDAIYFKQIRNTHEYINFGRLENVRKYWELHQLNIYYIYSIEMVLDFINKIVNNYSIIERNKLIKNLDIDSIFNQLNKSLDNGINTEITILEFKNIIDKILEYDRSNLDSKINESITFDKINSSEIEEKIANILIMLFLVFKRYSVIQSKIKDFAFEDRNSSFYSLFIEELIKYIDENDNMTLYRFLEYLCDLVINRHLFESTLRLYDSNTKNWVFTEDNGYLYAEGKKIPMGARDNRWNSINSLLLDLNFIKETDKDILLTEKGISWLKRIE